MAKGILTEPPKLERVSPGVYRNAQGKTIKSTSGKGGGGKKNPKQAKEKVNSQFTALTPEQRAQIEGRQSQDTTIQNAGGGMLQGALDSYSQPFDWSQLPGQPVQGDFNTWRDQQIDQNYETYNKRMSKDFDQQNKDFEQMMYERGIPIGSEVYNNQKAAMAQQQADARQNMLTGAMQSAGQNAGQFFDIGTQAYNNAYSQSLAKRNMGLNEYNQIMASQSPMTMQNLGYGQSRATLEDQQAQDRWTLKNTPRGGGGGGSDPYMGFGSAMGMWAAQDARTRANQQWMWQNQPGNSSPSYGAQVAGAIGSGLAQGFGNWMMK